MKRVLFVFFPPSYCSFIAEFAYAFGVYFYVIRGIRFYSSQITQSLDYAV